MRIKMAKSRRPPGRLRSQLANNASSTAASTALGNPSKREPATDGTQPDRSRSVIPVANKNRTNVRNVVTVARIVPTVTRPDSDTT